MQDLDQGKRCEHDDGQRQVQLAVAPQDRKQCTRQCEQTKRENFTVQTED